jgi:glycosyltransferase involved in cell wall biosynthesis
MEAITVVIPTRNRPELLRLTLTSVLRQRDVDLRVIVVDDGSASQIDDVISRFADTRVRVVRQPVSRGVSAARNRGVAEATTEWVALCDDDDVWSPEKLHRQLASARTLDRDWAYAGCVMVNAQLHIQGGSSPLSPEAMIEALLHYNAVPAGASNVVVRKDVLDRVGGFDESLTHVPDWDLWLRLARHGVPASVSEPLVAYRIHAGNASFRTAEMLAELYVLERRHGLTATRVRFHRHLAHLCLRSARRREALTHFMRAALRFRDGYSQMDLITDGGLLREHVGEIVRRRLGRPLSKRAAQRLQAARERDPNAGWKAQADAWLQGLRRG